ncbi:MAG: hypothetical protein F2521_02825 [Actinobacteria bacterium]|uniref:Unannotated protein n=1 Tax=freshwater metagenome TaxID=449393 RepID=A0A6J6B2P6_9ZZZZ|nr:hypothetical protein [Actinomycetota bacterium]
MKFGRSIGLLAVLLSALCIGGLLSVAVTTKSYSESYPAVVCPPTITGLSSQISLASKKTPFQRLQNRTTKTAPVKVLRLPVKRDSLVFNSEGVTPVVWQSKASSWAGGALCTGPATSQWFVGGTADITTKGRLIIVNSGLSDAIIDIQSFTENGKQPLRTITVVSKNYLIIPIDSLAPGDKNLTVHVAPRSGRINAFMIDEQGKGLKALGGDLINFAPSASKSVMIPAIPHQIVKNTKALPHTLRILTPGDVDANVTAEVLSADGVFVPVGLTSRSISAGIVTELQFTPNITSTIMGIRITSTEPIVAAIKSTVTTSGKKDFVWSTSAPALIPLTIAISGLNPLISFTGESINVALDVTLNNGKVVRKILKGTDIATWRAPESARSFTIVKVGPDTFAGALVSSVNGYGYFPIAPGSVLTKIELPDSNIRVLNP